MKTNGFTCLSLLAGVCVLVACGCAHDPNRVGVTNKNQPGPALGYGVGAAVGAVGGNVAGAVVGVGEGAAAAASAPFDTTTRVIRRWRTEQTVDGRTIQVPEDIVVDAYGRPVQGANTKTAAPATTKP
jgi:hypothetical protein